MDKQTWPIKIGKRPIGIFDSGLGGLTIVKEIIKYLPNEDIAYLGDTARVPYGTRSVETIKKFSLEDANFLINKKVKCIVVACHTSSATAGIYLKNKFKKMPVFDIVTPVLAELKNTKKRIGVIGTRATIASRIYSKLNAIQIPSPLLVPFIEEGETSGNLISLLVKKYLKEIKKNKVQTLVLGCTHYPIIEKVIKNVLPGVLLINPGVVLAKNLKDFLVKNNLASNQKTKGKIDYYVTDLNNRFIKVAEMFLGEKLKGEIRKVNIE